MDEWLIKQYEELAKHERMAGGSVKFNASLQYVAVKLSNGEEYFLQGEEASELLAECPDELTIYDYLLAKDW